MSDEVVERYVPIGFWRTIAVGLTGVLLTGAAAWMTFGGDKISRPEMVAYVTTQSPFAKSREVVELKLKQHDESLLKMERQVERLVESVGLLVVELRVLATKIDRASDPTKGK